jgi:hypothetical protein
MQRLSEIALGLLIISEEVVTSIATYGKEIAAQLVELWTAEGESPPDVEGNLAALGNGLAASEQRVAEADQRHVRQLAVTMGVRQQIREVNARIYRRFSKIRRVMDELHGAGKAFVLANIEGPTAETPRRLLRQCQLALVQLLDPSIELPSHELDGIAVDPRAMALGLQADVDLQRSLLADLRRERRLLQKTRKEKNRANEHHRYTLLWTSRIVEGYYMLAGEVELAERLRPATRRKSRPSTEPEGEAPEGEAPEGESPEAEGQTPSEATPLPAEATTPEGPTPAVRRAGGPTPADA